MSLYLIDGLPGTGKTTVGRILKSQGYEVYDGDEDNLAHWYSIDTGDLVAKEKEERTAKFLRLHSRKLDPNAVEQLASRAAKKDIFITNDPQNLAEVAKFFEKHFALILDEPIRQERLDERTNNDWGKLPHEREYDSNIATKAPRRYEQFEHVRLDASQEPNVVSNRLIALMVT